MYKHLAAPVDDSLLSISNGESSDESDNYSSDPLSGDSEVCMYVIEYTRFMNFGDTKCPPV